MVCFPVGMFGDQSGSTTKSNHDNMTSCLVQDKEALRERTVPTRNGQ